MAAGRNPGISWMSPAVIVAAPVLISVLIPVLVAPGEWTAWLLMVASLVVAPIADTIRKDRLLTLAVVAVVIVHHVVSLINAYGITLPGADIDAITFHNEATRLARNHRLYFDIGYAFYENLLGFFYILLGPTLLVGQGLSIFAFGLSCVVFVHLLDLFAITKYRWLLVLVFGLFPSTLLITSYTLRESWELLFFMLTTMCGIQFVSTRKSSWMLALLACAFGLALFHKALALYGVCFFVLSLFLASYLSALKSGLRRQLAVVLMVCVFFIWVAYFAIESTPVGRDFLSNLSSRGIVEYIYTYRMQIDFLGRPRTSFYVDFDSSTLVSTTLTFVKLFVYYLFSPLTGGGGGLKDAYGYTEALFRFVLLLSSIVTWYYARANREYKYGFLLLCYISMTFMWALGTTNYGQAIRHHVLTNWIIILAGLPPLLHVIKLRSRARRRSRASVKRKARGVESTP